MQTTFAPPGMALGLGGAVHRAASATYLPWKNRNLLLECETSTLFPLSPRLALLPEDTQHADQPPHLRATCLISTAFRLTMQRLRLWKGSFNACTISDCTFRIKRNEEKCKDIKHVLYSENAFRITMDLV